MRTYEEVLEEVLYEVRDSEYLDRDLNREVAKRYALEVAKEALKNASEKSQEMRYFIDTENTSSTDILNLIHRRSQTCYAVPKQSILSETNIPELI